MQNKARYFRIGLLTAGSLLVLLGMMFFLGLADEFAEKLHFVTTFSESVQGLTKGAAVKYKGVPIGTVERISILPEEKIIRVDMLIDPAVFDDFKTSDKGISQLDLVRQFCQRGKEAGLCCSMDMAGITGMRYIEMNYVPANKQRKNPLPEIKEPGVIYFPSVPGTFSNIVDSVALSLDKIAGIDVNRITSELENNLLALNRLLNDPALKMTIERLDKISKNVETLTNNFSENITGKEMKRLINGVNENLENINRLTVALYDKLKPVDARLLNSQLSEVLTSGKQLMDSLHDDSVDAVRAMQQLNSTLDNFNELIDDIKKDPSSLIRGKNAEPLKLDKK